jgi:hypothetical protein
MQLMLAMAAGAGALAVAGVAQSGPGCGCSPPPPPPPPNCGCHHGGHHDHHHGGHHEDFHLNVDVSAKVQAEAQANAQVQASGGGGGGFTVDEGPTTVIGGLNVDTGEQTQVRKVAFQATRKITERVVIQAICIDDRQMPHPASQVHAEREVEEGYEGEIYRCVAGTRMQATFAKYEGEISFNGARTIDCHKNEALYHGAGGEVVCREQKQERDCNERSLLRRYGAGVKILTMNRVETYTDYKEETVTSSEKSQTSGVVLDGGVGGVVR